MPTKNRHLLVMSCVCIAVLSGCGSRPAPPTAAIQGDTSRAAELAEVALEFSPHDFPVWRNVDQDGVESGLDVSCVTWGPEENVAWVVDVPGTGHSSPIIFGERVFLTTADESQPTQSVLAFDRTTGARLWETVCHRGTLPRMHHKNSHASSTPACDGQRVYAAFVNGSALYVTALNLAGEQVWQREVGPFTSEHGYGSSVLLWKGLVIVNGDSKGGGYEAALDRDSGDVLWRTPRPGVGGHGSYATPIVAELAGRPQLIQSGLGKVVSYDPLTGTELWRCDGPAEVTANTLAYQDPFVVVSGGYPEKEILCIRADGSGDVTGTHVQWRADRNVAYVPSPTIYENHLYCITDNGILACYGMNDGGMLWQERLGGNFSASPLVLGNTFYIPNEEGEVQVFVVSETGPSFCGKNRLSDGGGMASLAAAEMLATNPAGPGTEIFIRTQHQLTCVHPQ